MKRPFHLQIIIVGLFFVVFGGCDQGQSGSSSAFSYDKPAKHQTYKEAKETLEDKELANPLAFLDHDAKYRKNVFGEFVIEGVIINRATVAKYKDVNIQVKFYSKTKTNIATKTYTVYEFCRPKSRTAFKIKTPNYRGAKSLGWKIVSARAIR